MPGTPPGSKHPNLNAILPFSPGLSASYPPTPTNAICRLAINPFEDSRAWVKGPLSIPQAVTVTTHFQRPPPGGYYSTPILSALFVAHYSGNLTLRHHPDAEYDPDPNLYIHQPNLFVSYTHDWFTDITSPPTTPYSCYQYANLYIPDSFINLPPPISPPAFYAIYLVDWSVSGTPTPMSIDLGISFVLQQSAYPHDYPEIDSDEGLDEEM